MMLGACANADRDESVRMIHTALDAGINLVDTADVCPEGESEEIVGKALKGRRDDVVLAAKFFPPADPEGRYRACSAGWVTRAVEASLRRLGTDHIDLYQMHRPDQVADLGETMWALSDLVRSGKVRAIGSAVLPAELIVEAQWTAQRRGHHRFRTEQPPYSILLRGIESAVLPTARRYGLGILTSGPLSSGWLSGRADPATGSRAAQRPQRFALPTPGQQAKLTAVEQLSRLASDAGLPLTHLATAFVRAHPAVSSVLISPRRPEQLQDLLASAEVRLSEDVMDRIDEIVPPGTNLGQDDTASAPPSSERRRVRP